MDNNIDMSKVHPIVLLETRYIAGKDKIGDSPERTSRMKLLHFVKDGQYRLGVKNEKGIVDVAAALEAYPAAGVPVTLQEVLDGGQDALNKLAEFVDQAIAKAGSGEQGAYLLDEAKLTAGPAVVQPSKIICVGLNYRKHAIESNMAIPTTPVLFSKFVNALAADGEDVPMPKSEKVDYEVELAIVIGKTAKDVSKESALDYVFGYCTANDLSARDLQLRTAQWLLGKTCDKFAPIGPYLVTADEVGDPNNLQLKCTVNGEVRQNSNTSDMIFYCDDIISYVSEYMTLVPGDIILTGTPEGVIFGYPPERQVYLKEGDVITVEIEKLGALTNRLVAAR